MGQQADTASIPGEDLRDLGIDPTPRVTGLLVLWASEEHARLGEKWHFQPSSAWYSIGRGDHSPRGFRREHPVQQRPGEHIFQPPIATRTTSGDALLVRTAGEDLELDCVGRHPTLVNGQQVARCTVKPGDLVYLTGQFLLRCVRLPLPMSPLRHLHTRFMGPFGLANPFGTVCETELGWSFLDQCAFAAKRPKHVGLRGESGTGKEAAARMIHGMGPSARGPFAAISAGNLARSLLEDQLFGHVKDYPHKGDPALKGAIAEADGGTLFIDELGKMPLDMQVALLRVLDSGEYKPLGSEGVRHAKFRLVVAMNGPESAVMLDLRKRIDTWIDVPTLAARRDDIPLIVRHILRQIHAETPDVTKHLLREQADGSQEVVPPVWFIEELMKRECFDGNVRDLWLAVSPMLFATTPAQAGGDVQVRQVVEDASEGRGRALARGEIEWALGKHAGNVSAAARELGVSRQALYRAMGRVGVR